MMVERRTLARKKKSRYECRPSDFSGGSDYPEMDYRQVYVAREADLTFVMRPLTRKHWGRGVGRIVGIGENCTPDS
jgi:hypothetical protein